MLGAAVLVRQGDALDQGAGGCVFVQEGDVRRAAECDIAVAALQGDQVARSEGLLDGLDKAGAVAGANGVEGETV